MYFGKDAYRMAVGCQSTSLRHMTAFFINNFGIRAQGAVPDNAGGFKFITFGFYNISVINVDDEFFGSLFVYK